MKTDARADVSVRTEFYERLEQEARASGVTVSALVEKALVTLLEKEDLCVARSVRCSVRWDR